MTGGPLPVGRRTPRRPGGPGVPAPRADDQHVAPRPRRSSSSTTRRSPRSSSSTCNPAATSPDQRRVRAGSRATDLFTVVLEQRLTDTADFADIVLPATMQPEHARPARLLRAPVPAVQRAGGRPRPASACRTPRSSAASPPRLGLRPPGAARSPTSTSRRRCSGQAGIELDELRATAACASGSQRGTAPFAEGGFPTATRQGGAAPQALVDAPGATCSSATSCRTRWSTTSWPSGTRWCCSCRPAASSSTRRSPSCVAPRQDGRADRLQLHPSDAAARGPGRRRRGALHNDRGASTAAVAVERCDRARRLLHPQDAVAEALAGRRERERHAPRSATPTSAGPRRSTTTASRSRPRPEGRRRVTLRR